MNAETPSSAPVRKGRTARTLFIWVTLIITIGWIFHFPQDDEMLYRVISPDAIWVSEHDRLSERWEDMARNPVLLGVLSGMDVSPEEVQEFMIRGPWRMFTRMMTGRRAVVAYEDAEGWGQKPAWVFASSVGGAVQLVRWGVLPRLIPNMKTINLGLQRKVWIMPLDSKKARLKRRLVITTQDGLLIGVISENPTVIRDVLARLNCAPEEMALGWHPGQAFESQPYSDRAWMRDFHVDGVGKLPEMTLGCTSEGGSGVSGEVRMPSVRVMGSDVIDPAAATGLRRLLATKPDTFVCGSEPFLEGLGVVPEDSQNWKALQSAVLAVAPKAQAMCAALMSEEFSGRIHGIKIRSMMMGFPVGDAVTVDSVLSPLIDHVNARHPWGLVVQEKDVAGQAVRMLDCSQQQLVAGLEQTDKPACVVLDGWFFLVSNLSALEAFIGVQVPEEDPALAARMTTSFYARSNLDSTYEAVRNLLSVYLLSQVFEESAATKNARIRAAYDAMSQWAPVAKILNEAELWVETSGAGGGLKIAMRIGPQSDHVVRTRDQKGLY